jgi:integral membrane protein
VSQSTTPTTTDAPPGVPPRTRSALTRYRLLAWATGVFLLLLTLHVVLQVVQWRQDGGPYSAAEGLGAWLPGADAWVPIAHGYLYLVYVVVAVDLWFRTRLPLLPMAGVVLAGTVPFMSFVAERWVTRRLTATPPASDGL